MQLIRQLQERTRQLRRYHLDLSSLQFRLTIEIAALSILGLSSVAMWTSWKMQQILITTRTQNVEYIASR
jgi:hypothetical protein